MDLPAVLVLLVISAFAVSITFRLEQKRINVRPFQNHPCACAKTTMTYAEGPHLLLKLNERSGF